MLPGGGERRGNGEGKKRQKGDLPPVASHRSAECREKRKAHKQQAGEFQTRGDGGEGRPQNQVGGGYSLGFFFFLFVVLWVPGDEILPAFRHVRGGGSFRRDGRVDVFACTFAEDWDFPE